MSVRTKGNVLVDNIKVGDILYEEAYGYEIATKVITQPNRNEEGYWTWQSEVLNNKDNIITYGVHEKYPHYAPALYDYSKNQKENEKES